ncbi:MAG: YajQ family cyclic di-GMP-binding protein [Legionellales bacterium]|nr:YajQ family cyclic di-GMP-binding protein [Legionellales bacterium]|tara:strand:- start:57 stop:539 length:483 start_codon:yes stop_codon:yes gene_type:complete
MASFDVVSEIEQQELVNAIDQANREIGTRFDFKGTNSKVELSESVLTVISKSEFQIKQINEIIKNKINKRGIDIRCLEYDEITENNNETRQIIKVKKGIDKDRGRFIVKMIKNTKLKVQASIQGEQVRISGKKRDDLQNAISELKKAKIDIPLQYINFRD